MGKIARKYMAHYVDAGDGTLVRLGKDLEEYTPKLSAQVEKSQNILGQTNVCIAAYDKAVSVKPYYAEEGDPLFQRLQECRPWQSDYHCFSLIRRLPSILMTE